MKISNKTSAIEQHAHGKSVWLGIALCLITLLPALAHAQIISTVAGGFPNDGGPATSGALGNVQDIAYDAAGNLYLADIVDHRIRKIDTAGNITTFIGNGTSGYSGDGGPASAALISRPHGILFDLAGNMIFADRGNHRIRKVTPAGIISTIAGNGTLGYSGDGGPATAATMYEPAGLAFDAAGNLYIADLGNSAIRKVTTTGIIQTVAGTGTFGYNGDGIPATTAQLNFPRSVLVDASGNIYIGDFGNRRVRKVNTSGVITTIAGSGLPGYSGDGGPAISAGIGQIRGLAFDSGGNLLISNGPLARVRRVNLSTGIITRVAGTVVGFNGDGLNALSTRFNQGVTGMLFDSLNNLLIADSSSSRVRKVDALSQIVTTIAGGFLGDGNQALAAAFKLPRSVDLDASGNIYVVEARGFRVRKIDTTGQVTTIAGNGFNGYSGDGGPATSASIEIDATGAAVDSGGNVLIADYNNCVIRKVNTAGIITTIVGNGTACGYSGDGGLASAATINGPADPTFDAFGNLFFADVENCVVRKINTSNTITTVAGNGTCGFGGDGGPATSASLNFPGGIALDAAGNLYIADTANNRVRKVSTSGVITTIAGDGTGNFGGDGGPATSASLSSPADVEVNASGTFYITDTFNLRIRKVDAAGVITTLAGDGECCYSGDGGAAATARMTTPIGLALDGIGNLYFTDDNTYRIRKITFEPSQAISVLGSLIDSLNLDNGTTGSLQAKLDSAQKSLDKGKTSNAIKDLENFIKHVNSQRGKKLTDQQADQLVAAAQAIINLL